MRRASAIGSRVTYKPFREYYCLVRMIQDPRVVVVCVPSNRAR